MKPGAASELKTKLTKKEKRLAKKAFKQFKQLVKTASKININNVVPQEFLERKVGEKFNISVGTALTTTLIRAITSKTDKKAKKAA